MRVERRPEDYGKSDLTGASVLSFPFPEFPQFFRYSLSQTCELPAYTAEAATGLCGVACEQASDEDGKRTSAKLKNSESEANGGRTRLSLAESLFE